MAISPRSSGRSKRSSPRRHRDGTPGPFRIGRFSRGRFRPIRPIAHPIHGRQFTARSFGAFLVRHKIRRRFGAVGRPQAVARIDRFFRSLKDEIADELFALKPLTRINRELADYATWFNVYRVHEGLDGRTPAAVFAGRRLGRALRPKEGERLALCHRDLAGNVALPVFSLRHVA
jgi:hypothetical protein